MGLDMDIEAFGAPYPAENFSFTVRGGMGRITIAVFLNESQLMQTDCPDPPCHEMVFIPGYASGQLMIVATDSTGASDQTTFSIKNRLLSGGEMAGMS
jgi:hypothetical protein